MGFEVCIGVHQGSQVALVVKNPPANAGGKGDMVQFLGREDPWRRKWQPTPVFLPGESHEQRNLVGYSPWCCKELDMTERGLAEERMDA